MSRRPRHPDEPRDEELGAALSGIPTPDHGPTFWADLNHRLQGETVPNQTGSATDAGPVRATPTTEPAPVSLDERRTRRAARRGPGRMTRSLGAAAAAVALVVVAAGALTVINRDDNADREVRTADRPTGTEQPAPTTPDAPAEFSATYSFAEGIDSSRCPAQTAETLCRIWRFSLARDGSFRWTATDGSEDFALDMGSGIGRFVNIYGPNTKSPNTAVNTNLPPNWGAELGPLDSMGAFVISLARAGDPRITTTTVAGRAAWHYDGPTVQDRNGGADAPDHAVADVDQASGVLLQLTRSSNGRVVHRLTATEVTTSDQIDRARYRLEPPAGSRKSEFSSGFAVRTLDQAAAELPYDLLVPSYVPAGFTLDWSPGAVAVNREVETPTGAEGSNPPTKPVTSLTWRLGAQVFTIDLRPTGGLSEWSDPFGAEGMVGDAQPVRYELAGRPALEGTVVVDAPVTPHLWGTTGDVVVTISGDLSRAELERVAGSLRPYRG